MKIKLDITRTEIIRPKDNEYTSAIYCGRDCIYPDTLDPVIVEFISFEEFETENPIISDFINWMDKMPDEYNDEREEKFREAITAETDYEFYGVDEIEGSCISRVEYNDVTYWAAID